MVMPEIEFSNMTDEELSQLNIEVSAEINRRSTLTNVPIQMGYLNADYLDAAGVVEGEAWVQPTGAHDAYPKDWIVTHEGITWLSLMDANVWEPGVSGWAVGDGGEWPMWVQPTGAHDVYQAGAKVSHLELHWISDVANNSWEPGVYGWTEADD